MGFLGFGGSRLTYDMFDLARNAAEAKRFATCERIYHKGQVLAWDGKEILPMLLEKHGGVRVAPGSSFSARYGSAWWRAPCAHRSRRSPRRCAAVSLA